MATNKDVKPQNPIINRSHPLARGLVAAWPLHEGGGLRMRDIGRGNDATITGAVATDWVQTPHGSAFEFDGNNDIATTARTIGFSGPKRTISCWFKATTSSVTEAIWAFEGAATAGHRCIALWNWDISNQTYSGTKLKIGVVHWYYDVGSLATVTANEWHHFVYVSSGTLGSEVQLYIDGIALPMSIGVNGDGTLDVDDANFSIGDSVVWTYSGLHPFQLLYFRPREYYQLLRDLKL